MRTVAARTRAHVHVLAGRGNRSLLGVVELWHCFSAHSDALLHTVASSYCYCLVGGGGGGQETEKRPADTMGLL